MLYVPKSILQRTIPVAYVRLKELAASTQFQSAQTVKDLTRLPISLTKSERLSLRLLLYNQQQFKNPTSKSKQELSSYRVSSSGYYRAKGRPYTRTRTMDISARPGLLRRLSLYTTFFFYANLLQRQNPSTQDFGLRFKGPQTTRQLSSQLSGRPRHSSNRYSRKKIKDPTS